MPPRKKQKREIKSYSQPNWVNKTIWTGDNLPIMRGMNSESVDLIYLDPPFNSKANYAAPVGSKAAGAEFKDTWTLNDIDVAWINLISEKYPQLHRVLLAAMTESDKSYLVYMAVRLLEMHRLLKDTGSIYLHCDPTMSHYLKVIMDGVFGKNNFRNEIVWGYKTGGISKKWFARKHDIILFYSKSENYCFNPVQEKSYLTHGYGYKNINIKKDDKGSYREVYCRDWWDIAALRANQKEYLGYPTQKPLKLLRRIIKAGSNSDDIVLDPFCGCATTCVSAELEQRAWVGIDIAEKAKDLLVDRIKDFQGSLLEDIKHRTDIPKRTDLGKLPKYNCRENKEKLYGEQKGNCADCKEHFEMRNLTVNHIIDQNSGGTDHIENLQLLCGHCNSVKGDRGMPYLMAKLQMN